MSPERAKELIGHRVIVTGGQRARGIVGIVKSVRLDPATVWSCTIATDGDRVAYSVFLKHVQPFEEGAPYADVSLR